MRTDLIRLCECLSVKTSYQPQNVSSQHAHADRSQALAVGSCHPTEPHG